jgi:hypothetical protein
MITKKARAKAKGTRCLFYSLFICNRIKKGENQRGKNVTLQAKGVKFICSRIKTKAEAKGKKCHAKTMWSLEKPI